MASTTFVDKTTIINTPWLNDVNTLVWTVFNGATTAALARTALGLGTMALQNATAVAITGGTESGVAITTGSIDNTPIGSTTRNTGAFTTLALTTALSPANGGIGATGTPTNGQVPIGNGTNYTPATLTAGTGISVSNGAGTITISATNTGFSLGTPQASTSGTSIQFTGIPSGIKMLTISLKNVSTNGTSNYLIQIGPSGGVETSGYTSGSMVMQAAVGFSQTDYTTGFGIPSAAATNDVSGVYVFYLENSSNNTWTGSGNFRMASNQAASGGGSKSLAGVLERIRITTVSGTDTFDAGEINIMYQ